KDSHSCSSMIENSQTVFLFGCSCSISECSCGTCATMPTEAENICCIEIPQVTFSRDKLIMNLLPDSYGRSRKNYHVWYLAYRNFVRWCWGFLGHRIRVIIPACLVLRTCMEFPDATGHYVGIRLPHE
uniref:P2X purinoreceptor 7 intracellular domain-containing protein n=1 Tax=Seriola dumerili TaxID=41447 RepID=A0A3B4T3A2_SERDU